MQGLMLGHPQAHPGQILHLPSLAQHHRCALQRRLALRTYRRPMLDHRVGHGYQVQCLAAVAQLPARFLAAAPPQALRRAP
jgi:hypothetical protein